MKLRILGWLLHHANASPPVLLRNEFYTLKSQLLTKYGTDTGFDIQHILKECWDCQKGCYKCNTYGIGKGIWNEFWVYLQKRELGGYEFHIPLNRMYQPPIYAVTIEGFISHRTPKYRLNKECALWLFLVFEPRMFFRNFGNSGSCGNMWTPLVILESLVFKLRWPHCWLGRWQRRFERFRRRHSRHPQFISLNIDYDDDVPF